MRDEEWKENEAGEKELDIGEQMVRVTCLFLLLLQANALFTVYSLACEAGLC